MTPNLFSKAIERLLDETELFSRREWANLLDVSVPEIERWLKEESLPRSDHLCMLWSFIELHLGDIPEGPISFFKEIANYPAEKVSAFGEQMMPNVWEYMQKPVIEY